MVDRHYIHAICMQIDVFTCANGVIAVWKCLNIFTQVQESGWRLSWFLMKAFAVWWESIWLSMLQAVFKSVVPIASFNLGRVWTRKRISQLLCFGVHFMVGNFRGFVGCNGEQGPRWLVVGCCLVVGMPQVCRCPVDPAECPIPWWSTLAILSWWWACNHWDPSFTIIALILRSHDLKHHLPTSSHQAHYHYQPVSTIINHH